MGTRVAHPARTAWRAVLLSAFGLLLAGPSPARGATPAADYRVDPTREIAASAGLLQRGTGLYRDKCAACHGPEGHGDGAAAYLLYPKPRDFSNGFFRYTSTWDGIPSDDDLYRIISRGMPGSAMPSWAHLPEEDRWALVHFVKTLSQQPLVVQPTVVPNPEEDIDGQGLIAVAPEPPDSPASRARGGQHFQKQCTPCHGPRGQGDGPQVAQLRDNAGFPIRPRDLTTGVFKGSPRPDRLYQRILGGVHGTPMPASPHLMGDDGWDLVHFVRSLSSDPLRERAEMQRLRIVAPRVVRLPDHPDAGGWKDLPSTQLHLMPLWWRYNRPEYVTVQAAHDGKELAVLMVWADDTHDEMAVRPQDFRDGAAVQFAATEDPPFFAMGEMARFVNIWMWKSDREADLAGFRDVDTQYPWVGIDSYPNLQRAAYEQPMRHAATLESDPTFITGWGAGNIVSDPTRRSAAEDLVAQGFGTLKARPRAEQAVAATGVYATGSYRVVFRRALEPAAGKGGFWSTRKGQGTGIAHLRPGTTVPVAFALWNGSAGDRDGNKSITIWQDLILAK